MANFCEDLCGNLFLRNQPKLAKLRNLLSVEFNSLEVTLLCQQAYGENDLMFGKFVSRVGIQEGIFFYKQRPVCASNLFHILTLKYIQKP